LGDSESSSQKWPSWLTAAENASKSTGLRT
jgi:hypothetical protein